MPDAFADTFRALAIAAGRKIMEIYDSDDLGVEAKADDSPVTRADLAADAVIREGLTGAYPGLQLVTEEMASSHGGARDERFILVDPLDGTKEFVRRGGDFTVNIALIENGAPRTSRSFEIDRAERFLKGSGIPARIPVIAGLRCWPNPASATPVSECGPCSFGFCSC